MEQHHVSRDGHSDGDEDGPRMRAKSLGEYALEGLGIERSPKSVDPTMSMTITVTILRTSVCVIANFSPHPRQNRACSALPSPQTGQAIMSSKSRPAGQPANRISNKEVAAACCPMARPLAECG